MPVQVKGCSSATGRYFRQSALHWTHQELQTHAWEGTGIKSKSLAMLYQTCSQYNVDLGRIFAHFGGDSAIMSGAQFYEFSHAAQLMAATADAHAFFQLTMGGDYRATMRISAERFDAGLVRVFEHMSGQRGLKHEHACNTLVRDHLVPLSAELFGQTLEPHAHQISYGYGGPHCMTPQYGESIHERYAPAVSPYSQTHDGRTRDLDGAAQHVRSTPGRRFMA
eukprot:TRINITY_DN3344_c0_g1_i1.p1 TRINITY_DN3344_c0_g1~~TRINITY_DN3344_c0_g1_i1.p1  ORF type:complete len:223 (-),score=16.66 TRINITY_DN3344_c0_g1_i1:351-1019(-)